MSTALNSVSGIPAALTNSEFVASYIGGGTFIQTKALQPEAIVAQAGFDAKTLANLNPAKIELT